MALYVDAPFSGRFVRPIAGPFVGVTETGQPFADATDRDDDEDYFGRSSNDGYRIFIGEASFALGAWHSGMDDIYAVSSTGVVNSELETIAGAVYWLRSIVRSIEAGKAAEPNYAEGDLPLEDIISCLEGYLDHWGWTPSDGSDTCV